MSTVEPVPTPITIPQPKAPATTSQSSSLSVILPPSPAPSATPSLPPPIPVQLSRLEYDAQQLVTQFTSLLSTVSVSETHLATLTSQYTHSLLTAASSSASACDIRIDTNREMILQMLQVASEFQQIELLERQVTQTKASLSVLEKGMEQMRADDAIQATRAQLQQGLHERTHSTSATATSRHLTTPMPASRGDQQQEHPPFASPSTLLSPPTASATAPDTSSNVADAASSRTQTAAISAAAVTILPDGTSSSETLPPPQFDAGPITHAAAVATGAPPTTLIPLQQEQAVQSDVPPLL